MSRDEILSDLYERLSSRKLWLCLLSIAFAAWNHAEGRLSSVEFQTAVFGAIGVYTVSEGLTDAVAAYRPRPSGDAQTVNVGTEALPLVAPEPAKPRPARAKPKGVAPHG